MSYKPRPDSRNRKRKWPSSVAEDTKEEEPSEDDTEVMEEEGEDSDEAFLVVLRELVEALKILNGTLNTKLTTTTTTHPSRS